MESYDLGGLAVSRVALGCWGFAGGDMWGPQDESDSAAVVSAALDAGINFFETAQAYGNGLSEAVLGRALKGRRGQAVIATKIKPMEPSRAGIVSAVEESLRRLQTDTIDLLQPHWPLRSLPPAEICEAFDQLRQSGKIRAFGVSNYGVNDLQEILASGRPVSNQVPYSLLFRAIEYEIQPLCAHTGVGLLCYSTLLHGLLSGRYRTPDDFPAGRARTRHFSPARGQVRHNGPGCEAETFAAIAQIRLQAEALGLPMSILAAAWVLHQPGVACVLGGATRPEQISELARAADVHLGTRALQALEDATAPVKNILGSNPDMWQTKSRFN